MSKHTKGPWMTRQMFSGNWDIAAENGNGDTIARTRDEANARLIASAPEMLETIKKCLAYMIDDKSSDVTGKEALDSINAILTKIEA